ncbi:HD domain-containing protein [Clostridium aestuarii]|uniref:HD domain-containing protein n=1 Tax=Clostridium aestuarii TaxID=338193 RepID=A0ABT4D1J1_9CLOT|nr:HD domain-containing phosphohydrolase [Clostridium aestuarii]MCY6484977.1 HD domain-containing protein [Clostridium aestuarii]
MENKQLKDVKSTVFRTIIKNGLMLGIMIFTILIIFVFSVSYLFIEDSEKNISNVMINDVHQKIERIISVSNFILDIESKKYSYEEKNSLIQNTITMENDILGVLILDKKGIVTNAFSRELKNSYSEFKDINFKSSDFIGIDFSGKEYYKQVIKTKKIYITKPYVQYLTGKLSLNIVSPIIKNNNIEGMNVILVNPEIIQNKKLKDIEYYITKGNGNIIFKSLNDDKYIESSIDMHTIERLKKKDVSIILYKNHIKNKYMVSTIMKIDIADIYIIVEYDIFGNKDFWVALLGTLIFYALLIIIITFIHSAKASNNISNEISIFSNVVGRIASGDYYINCLEKYNYKETNDIIESLSNMANKINEREQELQAYNEELRAANDEINSMLSTISKNEKMKKDQYKQIMWTLLNLIEIKDKYTAGHSKNVTYYTKKIAERMNLEHNYQIDVDKVDDGAMLHDIGKISINENLLNKPGKLTDEEFEIIKTHTEKGYYALKDIENLKEEREMVKHHHERYDGCGYPDGLKGKEIPLGARIIAVADSFDAMVSDRPYRKGMSLNKALEQLENNKGTQFDADVVDVFLSIIKENNEIYDSTKK